MMTLKEYCIQTGISYISAYQAFRRGAIPGSLIFDGMLCVPDDCEWRPAKRGRPSGGLDRLEVQRIWQHQKNNYGTGYPLPDATIEQMVRLGEKYRLHQVSPSLIEVCFEVFQSLTVEQLEDPQLVDAREKIVRRWREVGYESGSVKGDTGLHLWLCLFFDWAVRVGSIAVRRHRKASIAAYNRALAETRVRMFAAQL